MWFLRFLLMGLFVSNILPSVTYAAIWRYGEHYCHTPNFTCHKVKKNESWESLFPDSTERDIVMRVNRMNIALRRGMMIAIPDNLSQISLFDVSPFPLEIKSQKEKLVIADLGKLAWGAYDKDGNLVFWGPLSSARGYCPDEGMVCNTVTGAHRVFYKEGYNCTSSIFPIPTGGAAMPFCMHYYKGYAFHGSFEVPGYNASHGCIRMFIPDARWLNEQFATVGTKVIVKPAEDAGGEPQSSDYEGEL